MTMKGQEDSIPLTENDQMASWKKNIENMTELLKILSDKDNWDLGARDETRYLHKSNNISTIVSVAFSSVCGPTYHWGGLLASLASEAKRRYNAIRSNIGPSLEDSAKIPTGQLDLQFLQFWIKRNAWEVTKRSV